jgi:hypothetical protein
VRHANKLAIAGLAALACALALSFFLVSEYLFGGVVAGIAVGLVVFLVVLLWYAMPLWIRLRDPGEDV